jgi:hypothetical protein
MMMQEITTCHQISPLSFELLSSMIYEVYYMLLMAYLRIIICYDNRPEHMAALVSIFWSQATIFDA